jgi:hypothetical protein
MNERRKGDEYMPTITLKQLEKRIQTNAKQSEEVVERVAMNIRSRNLTGGRVRPKHPTEEKILARFNQK